MFKLFFKTNSHNAFFKALAGLGRSINRIYENRNHNPESNGEVTILKKISKYDPQVIIDGGANIGNYALRVNDFCKSSTIYCFEPVKDTFDKLEANSKNIGKITAINKGLYYENCSKTINIFPSNEHASIYEISNTKQKSTNSLNIDLIKGDDFLQQYNINSVFFLKLDLEGAEYDALKGFEQHLKSNKIRLIQFEYGYINVTTKRLLIDYYQLFESFNFIVGKVFPKGVEFRKYEFKYEDFIGPNFIAVHKDDADLIQTLKIK